MMRVWFGAVAAVVVILTGFWLCGSAVTDKPLPTGSIEPVDFSGIEHLAIGSSRFRYGLAGYASQIKTASSGHQSSVPVADSLANDVQVLQLAAVNLLGETQSQDLLEQAVTDGVGQILLEVNDFVYALYLAQPVENAPYRAGFYSLLNQLKSLRGRMVKCLRSSSVQVNLLPVDGSQGQVNLLNGKPITFVAGLPDGRDDEFRQFKLDKRHSDYLFRLKSPVDLAGLQGIVEMARSEGIRVQFILPPMSRFELSIEGQPPFEMLVERVKSMASELGLPVWVQVEPWPDTLFSDISHLNTEGRRRFQSQLNDWIEAIE